MAEDKDEVKAQIPKAEDVTIIIQPILIQNLKSQLYSFITILVFYSSNLVTSLCNQIYNNVKKTSSNVLPNDIN